MKNVYGGKKWSEITTTTDPRLNGDVAWFQSTVQGNSDVPDKQKIGSRTY